MSSFPKTSSVPSRSASDPTRRPAGRSVRPDARPFQDNSRLSPTVGSATDRLSDPEVRFKPNASTSAPGPSTKPKRVKVSAKSVLIPTSAPGPSTKPKKKIVKKIHTFEPSKNKFSGTVGSYKLKPQKKKNVDAMLTLANFAGVFDDELEEDFLAEEEEEGKEDDLGDCSPSPQTNLPLMPEGSPPMTNSPPLPAGSPPPLAVIPPMPVDDSFSTIRTSPYSVQMAGVKRAREAAGDGSAELPQTTRLRTEATPAEDQVNVAPDGQVIPDEEKVEDQAAGLGSEGEDRSARDAD
ncbi:unnamed protein product [Cochlearia groenlandica]